MKALCIAVSVAALALEAANAGEVGFTTKPKAVRAGDKVTITFAVSAATDVAVEILGTDGTIVRHLGGAVLGGENPPPPPFGPGLAQAVPWDGRDDAGKPVHAPRKRGQAPSVKGSDPFSGLKVRVRLGLQAAFDRFIGWQDVPPLNRCSVNGLAVGPDRRLYVISIDHISPPNGRSENRLWVMSPDGKYLRTLYPYPATMDPARLPGADFLSNEANRLEPRVYDRVCASYLPQMRAVNRQTMAATSNGRLVFMNGWATELYVFGPRSIMIMKTDGSIPRERIDGPRFSTGIGSGYGKNVKPGYTHLALSPDEKSAYVCGMAVKRYGKADNVVYRVGLNVEDKPEIIFGRLGEPAGGKEGLNDVRGIAVDGTGRVYVSDFGNDRIVVLEPTGTYAGEIPLKGPGVISVHPRTGAVYAISMPVAKGNGNLVKIGRFENPEVVAELGVGQFTTKKVGNHPIMALDPHGEKPIIYLGSPSPWARYRLLRVFDNGAALRKENIAFGPTGRIKGFPYPQGTDGDGNFFFKDMGWLNPHRCPFKGWEVKAGTGEFKPWRCRGGHWGTVGKDGFFYWGAGKGALTYSSGSVARTDRGGKVVPFAATGEMSEKYNDDRFCFARGNLHILPSGDIWALYRLKDSRMRVGMLGPDGTMKREGVIKGLENAASLRVDSQGNIYVASGYNLYGQPYSPEIVAFAKRLREKGTTGRGYHSEAVEDAYGEGCGAILKFGPEGGEIREAKTAGAGETLLEAYPYRTTFAAKRLKRVYPRISPMAPPRFSACWCLTATFDIDGYDRLFVPDAMQFRVRVLDANFNEILVFGGYDSATMKGGEANAPGPDIPFEFPSYVHASDTAAYVTDAASCAHRIVRVRLGYTIEETCEIR